MGDVAGGLACIQCGHVIRDGEYPNMEALALEDVEQEIDMRRRERRKGPSHGKLRLA